MQAPQEAERIIYGPFVIRRWSYALLVLFMLVCGAGTLRLAGEWRHFRCEPQTNRCSLERGELFVLTTDRTRFDWNQVEDVEFERHSVGRSLHGRTRVRLSTGEHFWVVSGMSRWARGRFEEFERGVASGHCPAVDHRSNVGIALLCPASVCGLFAGLVLLLFLVQLQRIELFVDHRELRVRVHRILMATPGPTIQIADIRDVHVRRVDHRKGRMAHLMITTKAGKKGIPFLAVPDGPVHDDAAQALRDALARAWHPPPR